MTKQWCAHSAWLVLAIISLMGMSEAQTHIFPAQDTNNVFTGANRFNAGVGVQYSGITISRPKNTSAPVLNQLVKETGSANPRQVTNLAVSDTNNILGLMVGTDSDTGDAVILDRGRGQCVFDGQTVVGDWVVSSTTSAGSCSDAGPTEPALVQVLGRVVSVNAGAGTVAYMNLGTFDVVGNQQVNGGGSGTVAAGTTGAIAYYPQNGNQVGPDTSCTTDGSGHLVCKSYTAADANAAGFIGCTQGPVPTLSTANSVYFLCGTSITSSIGFTVPSAVGTTGQGLCKTGSTTDGSGHNIDTWGYCTFGASGASVSSVGLTVNGTSPSGIFTVTGSPVTTSGSLNFNLAGTSGGIPYFSSGTVLSSSAALTANQLVLGGGAGTTPATLGSLGTTTTVLHGNAGGAPSFAATSLTADVSGILPIVNGGTNTSSTLTGIVRGGASYTAAELSGDATTSGSNAVTLAAKYKVKTCEMVFGDPGAGSSALANDNDAPVTCGNVTGADMTITAVACYADAGSPTVTPILTGGSGTSILSGALTCGTASWAAGTVNGSPVLHSFSANGATCSSTPCTLDANITTAGGTAKYIVMRFTMTQ